MLAVPFLRAGVERHVARGWRRCFRRVGRPRCRNLTKTSRLSYARWRRIPGMPRLFIEDRRGFDGGLQDFQCGAYQVSAPLQLFCGRKIGIAHRVVKLVTVHDPVGSNLSRHVGEASDDDHRNSLPLDLFCNRSAATRAGPSGRGKDDAVHTRGGKLPSDVGAEFLHLAWHSAGAGRNIIVVMQFAEVSRAL